jgi:hypothetical protein
MSKDNFMIYTVVVITVHVLGVIKQTMHGSCMKTPK